MSRPNTRSQSRSQNVDKPARVQAVKSGAKRKTAAPVVERPVKRARVDEEIEEEEEAGAQPEEDMDDDGGVQDDPHETTAAGVPEERGKPATLQKRKKTVSAEVNSAENAAEAGNSSGRTSRQEHEEIEIPDTDDELADAGASRAGKKSTDKGKTRAAEEDNGEGTKQTASRSKRKSSNRGKKNTARPISRAKLELDGQPAERPDITKKLKIRRIIAQRDIENERFYFVDWYPTWVKASDVRREEIKDWTYHETDTFQWGHDTVYRVDNPTSDDSRQLVRQLLESVLQMYQEYINPDPSAGGRSVVELANELFEDGDWEFFDHKQQEQATQATADDGEENSENITAAEVMRHTFVEAWNHKNRVRGSSARRRYQNIHVLYNGEIDNESTVHQLQPEAGKTAVSFIGPIFARELWSQEYMNVSNWDVRGRDPTQVRVHVQRLAPLIEDLVQNCPYLFKQAWPLALISLFFWGEQIVDLVARSEFEFELEGDRQAALWASRVQDQLMYTYVDECEWEHRCVDEVWQTFVEAQVFIAEELAFADGTAVDSDDDGDDGVDKESRGAQTKGTGKGKARDGKGPSKSQADASGKAAATQAGNAPRQGRGNTQPRQTDNGEGPSGPPKNGRATAPDGGNLARKTAAPKKRSGGGAKTKTSGATTAAASAKGKERVVEDEHEIEDW